MFGLGPSELLIIAVIVLILFGAKRLPEIGKGLGGAIREFRNVRKDLTEPPNEVEQPLDTAPVKTVAEPPAPRPLEAKLTDAVIGQVPGVKRAMEVKDKAQKIKAILQ